MNAGKSILSLTPKATEFELQVSSCVNVSLLDYVVADMLTAMATGSLSSLDRPNAAKVSAAGIKVSQFPFNDLMASGTVPELGFTCGYADATSTGIVPPKFEAEIEHSKDHGSSSISVSECHWNCLHPYCLSRIRSGVHRKANEGDGRQIG